MKVQNMTNSNGNKVANQFIIYENGNGANGNFIRKTVFQSYDSVIAEKIMWNDRTDIRLDKYKTSKNSGVYYVELGVGIEPMCGHEWLDANWNNLKDYKPEMSITLPGYSNTFTLNNMAKAKDVIKSCINKTMLKAIEPELYTYKSYFKKSNLVPAMA